MHSSPLSEFDVFPYWNVLHFNPFEPSHNKANLLACQQCYKRRRYCVSLSASLTTELSPKLEGVDVAAKLLDVFRQVVAANLAYYAIQPNELPKLVCCGEARYLIVTVGMGAACVVSGWHQSRSKLGLQPLVMPLLMARSARMS